MSVTHTNGSVDGNSTVRSQERSFRVENLRLVLQVVTDSMAVRSDDASHFATLID